MKTLFAIFSLTFLLLTICGCKKDKMNIASFAGTYITCGVAYSWNMVNGSTLHSFCDTITVSLNDDYTVLTSRNPVTDLSLVSKDNSTYIYEDENPILLVRVSFYSEDSIKYLSTGGGHGGGNETTLIGTKIH